MAQKRLGTGYVEIENGKLKTEGKLFGNYDFEAAERGSEFITYIANHSTGVTAPTLVPFPRMYSYLYHLLSYFASRNSDDVMIEFQNTQHPIDLSISYTDIAGTRRFTYLSINLFFRLSETNAYGSVLAQKREPDFSDTRAVSAVEATLRAVDKFLNKTVIRIRW